MMFPLKKDPTPANEYQIKIKFISIRPQIIVSHFYKNNLSI